MPFIQNKKGYVVSLYRSPSQTQVQLNDFLHNFEQLLSNINFLLIASDLQEHRLGGERIQQPRRALKLKHLLVLMG